MADIKILKTKKNDIPDLIFTFKQCNIDINFEDGVFTKNEQEEIDNIIQHMSKEIIIDKSYVEFPENKHWDVFISEEEWNNLCELIYNIKFKCKKESQKKLKEYYQIFYITYILMIENYLYMILEKYNYNVEFINLHLKENSYFSTEIEIDTIHEWKYYPGPWQNW